MWILLIYEWKKKKKPSTEITFCVLCCLRCLYNGPNTRQAHLFITSVDDNPQKLWHRHKTINLSSYLFKVVNKIEISHFEINKNWLCCFFCFWQPQLMKTFRWYQLIGKLSITGQIQRKKKTFCKVINGPLLHRRNGRGEWDRGVNPSWFKNLSNFV